MFGCRNIAEVIKEIESCQQEYPKSYIRLIGFDSTRQVQCAAFVAARPISTKVIGAGYTATAEQTLRGIDPQVSLSLDTMNSRYAACLGQTMTIRNTVKSS